MYLSIQAGLHSGHEDKCVSLVLNLTNLGDPPVISLGIFLTGLE